MVLFQYGVSPEDALTNIHILPLYCIEHFIRLGANPDGALDRFMESGPPTSPHNLDIMRLLSRYPSEYSLIYYTIERDDFDTYLAMTDPNQSSISGENVLTQVAVKHLTRRNTPLFHNIKSLLPLLTTENLFVGFRTILDLSLHTIIRRELIARKMLLLCYIQQNVTGHPLYDSNLTKEILDYIN